ncbi:outer membrane beta-barrel protein [Ferrimonas lipolytica]|uniref:Porin family protein n=1 Tax=Ferrimonas lipolytica TaxID=2724191 RepID=A0A6H1UG67_9GAMM|nr:outer membrane beta-barrel protein [Ferrimonas lipolytica]QIZ77818.1 porin family protein [Ferrimonas lipolytica]
MRQGVVAAIATLLSGSALAAEPNYFIAPMYGMSFGGEFDTTDEVEGERTDVGDLEIDSDSHVGFMIGRELDDPGNVYLLYSKQSTSFKTGSFGPSNGVDLDVSYLHFGGSLYFPNGDFVPYVTASVGVTEFKPDGDYSSEYAFSMGLGLGARYNITRNIGIYADARSFFSGYESSSDLVCFDQDGQCKLRLEADAIVQGQVNIGLLARF